MLRLQDTEITLLVSGSQQQEAAQGNKAQVRLALERVAAHRVLGIMVLLNLLIKAVTVLLKVFKAEMEIILQDTEEAAVAVAVSAAMEYHLTQALVVSAQLLQS